MKKHTNQADEDMAAEYHLDYSKGKPNRFAARYASGRVAVVLDKDVAAVFKTPEAVNNALRTMIDSQSASTTEAK
jgi:hypothetical protein